MSKIFAHRGFSGKYPENTMLAFVFGMSVMGEQEVLILIVAFLSATVGALFAVLAIRALFDGLYTVAAREFGESKWNFIKLLKYAVDGIISFSTFPLKFVTTIGLITSFASVVYLIAVIIQKLFFGIDVPGYATIVVLVLFLGGIQLFCLGLLGEYLSKIYVQVKNRPIYILKEHLGKDE